MRRLRLAILALVLGGAVFFAVRVWKAQSAPFNAARMAAAETRMWQAYYTMNVPVLGSELIGVMTREFGLTTDQAREVGAGLAAAAFMFLQFGPSREAEILAPLERAYERLEQYTGGGWDPREAARAELDWWVARRAMDRNSTEAVGRSISRLYSVLLGKTNEHIERAGQLRARAAHLRDSKGLSRPGPAWDGVQDLLAESYEALLVGIAAR